MEKYKIIGVRTRTAYGAEYFDGFELENVPGAVDPLLDMSPPELDDYHDARGNPTPEYPQAELAWAKKQVGKYLVCEALLYKAYTSVGTEIVDKQEYNPPSDEALADLDNLDTRR